MSVLRIERVEVPAIELPTHCCGVTVFSCCEVSMERCLYISNGDPLYIE